MALTILKIWKLKTKLNKNIKIKQNEKIKVTKSWNIEKYATHNEII